MLLVSRIAKVPAGFCHAGSKVKEQVVGKMETVLQTGNRGLECIDAASAYFQKLKAEIAREL